MNLLAAIFAPSTANASSASTNASSDNTSAQSEFASILAEMQCVTTAPDMSQVTDPNAPVTSDANAGNGETVSTLAKTFEHTPASALLLQAQTDLADGQTLTPPSDLAGLNLAAQQTLLPQLLHAALNLGSGNAAAMTQPASEANTQTALLQSLAGKAGAADAAQNSSAQTPTDGLPPEFAALLDRAQQRPAGNQPAASHATQGATKKAPIDTTGLAAQAPISSTQLTSTDTASAVHQPSSLGSGTNALHANASGTEQPIRLEALPVTQSPQQTSVQPSFSIDLQQAQSASTGSPLMSQVPVEALAVQIARRFEQGISKFEISLHPADLGKVDVSLNVAEDGRVHAVLRVEKAETLDLLRQDSRTLEAQLRQAGLDVGSNSLSFQLSQGNAHRHGMNRDNSGFNSLMNDGNASNDIAVTNYIAVRKRDGLDIHV